MPVKIRLMRIGAKRRPFYRVVAVDEQRKRTGGYLELLGTYNPLTSPKEILLKQERIDYWLKVGAVPSDGFLRITGKAPQRPPRKPKKEKASAPAPVAKVAEELEGKEGLEVSDKTAQEESTKEKIVENTEEPVEETSTGEAQTSEETTSPEEVPTIEEAPKSEETPSAEDTPFEEKAEQPEAKEENTEKS